MIEPNHNNTVTPPRLPEAMPLTSFSTPQPPIWSLQGRFGRFNYLAWSILFGLIYFAIVILLASSTPMSLEDLDTDAYLTNFFSVGNFLNLIWFIPFLLFSIKRFHDRNQSGWLCILLIIPIVNIFAGLYLIFAPGDLSPNQYGHKRETQTWESIFAWIYIILASFILITLTFTVLPLLLYSL